MPNPKSVAVVKVNLSPVPSKSPIPVPYLTAPVVVICALPTAVTVFFALLNGLIKPFALPSIITSFVPTLSIVDCASCTPFASFNVIVCPAAGVVPVNPLYLILVLPSPLRPSVPSNISIPLSAK